MNLKLVHFERLYRSSENIKIMPEGSTICSSFAKSSFNYCKNILLIPARDYWFRDTTEWVIA